MKSLKRIVNSKCNKYYNLISELASFVDINYFKSKEPQKTLQGTQRSLKISMRNFATAIIDSLSIFCQSVV